MRLFSFRTILAAPLLLGSHLMAGNAEHTFIQEFNSASIIGSTVPGNGDVNPYGIAVVPVTAGSLEKDSILISNFNNSSNLQGTGTTIVQLTPTGNLTLFASISASSLPGPCPGGIGLTTALVVLRSGFVVVGSLPTTDGTAATAQAGCLIVLNSSGEAVATLSGEGINGPWDMTALDLNSAAVLFVSNVLNGTVAANGQIVTKGSILRLVLETPAFGPPHEFGRLTIASAFEERTDPAALLIGPTGLALASDGQLFIADTLQNRIAVIRDALLRTDDAGAGVTVATGHGLNGPLGLAIAPNGDIVTVNANDGNMVETTRQGKQVAVKAVDTSGQGAGTLFGLAMAPLGQGCLLRRRRQQHARHPALNPIWCCRPGYAPYTLRLQPAHRVSASLFRGMRPFSRRGAVRDSIAGIELGAMSIPQALGYATIAGMPPVTGLYTLFLPLLSFATFGSSNFLVVAADSATAAILAGGLTPMAAIGSPHYVALAGMTALLTAGFLLIARLLKLGFLADFLSRTVLVGFLTGVGFQVGIAVLGEMLGLEVHSRRSVMQLIEIVRNAPRIHIPSFELAAAVVIGVVLLDRFAPRIPGALIAVVAAMAASAAWNFAGQGIGVIGPIAGGLPHMGLSRVPWKDFEPLVPIAASCFVMIVAQSAATARVYSVLHHQPQDENADLVGLGVANAAAALSGTFVVNGSPSQTAMAERSGGRSQVTHVAAAVLVALVLLFLTRPFQYLPRCVLGAIVFTVAIHLTDFRGLHRIRLEESGRILAGSEHCAGRHRGGRRTGNHIRDGCFAAPHRQPQLSPPHRGSGAGQRRPLAIETGGRPGNDAARGDRLPLRRALVLCECRHVRR